MRWSWIAIAVLALVVIAPTAAFASELRINDELGDGTRGNRLDVRAATLANADADLRVTVRFAGVTTGNVDILLKFKGEPGYIRASIKWRPRTKHGVRNYLHGSPGRPDPEPCPERDAGFSYYAGGPGRAIITVPAECLHGGEYDEVKFKVRTEGRKGDDIDLAPASRADPWFWSEYTARG